MWRSAGNGLTVNLAMVGRISTFKSQMYAIMDEVRRKHSLKMGRYLTPEEREDIKRLVPDTGPDWSEWKGKLESGEVSAAIKGVANAYRED